MQVRRYRRHELTRVAAAEAFQSVPALAFGDCVRLNSGSPCGLIADVGEDSLTVAWPDGQESALPRACLNRYKAR